MHRYGVQKCIMRSSNINTRPRIVDMRAMQRSSQSYSIHIDTIGRTTTHIEIVQNVVTVFETYRSGSIDHRPSTRDDSRTGSQCTTHIGISISTRWHHKDFITTRDIGVQGTRIDDTHTYTDTIARHTPYLGISSRITSSATI